MKLVEVIRTDQVCRMPCQTYKRFWSFSLSQTSDSTFAALADWGRAIGKHAVACKDTEGFIVNRLLGPYVGDAIAMVERGDATFQVQLTNFPWLKTLPGLLMALLQDVDAAVKLGLGYPMGPFELLDYTGIDLHKHINDNPDFPLARPSKLIDQMVEEGKLGMKTGQGFYNYSKSKK